MTQACIEEKHSVRGECRKPKSPNYFLHFLIKPYISTKRDFGLKVYFTRSVSRKKIKLQIVCLHRYHKSALIKDASY